jgi:hypothetical protein
MTTPAVLALALSAAVRMSSTTASRPTDMGVSLDGGVGLPSGQR